MATDLAESSPWLFSRRADFWFASGGASLALLAAVLVILWHGDRELDATDLVLSELHLGATYGAIIQRRLWRNLSADVIVAPAIILVLTYMLSISGQKVLLTSIAMYAAVWHRGRQSLGIARFYQREAGGPVSGLHNRLFRGAIYLPMLAAVFAYTHLAPNQYEDEPYIAIRVGAELTFVVGMIAAAWVLVYFIWAVCIAQNQSAISAANFFELRRSRWIHPGEWWVVAAHAVAFGSSYALGASTASFLLVLAVHHEVQYLYFTYAIARRQRSVSHGIETGTNHPRHPSAVFISELNAAAHYLLWPAAGFTGAIVGGWLNLALISPLGPGGLFCHYWLDGRIWIRAKTEN